MEHIGERSREVIDSISETIWAINPKNDSLQDLLSYIRDHAMRHLSLKSIRCRSDIPETVPDVRNTAESRRAVFFVVKEALHNIVKHSGATEATAYFSAAPRVPEIRISDNGVGVDPEDFSRRGKGLSSVKKRLEDAGGTFGLTSRPGGGTEIRITVPSSG